MIETAHEVGLKTTATIMFGHVDGPINWARHLIAIRDVQSRTGGFTEFVPLPFVPMESPIYLKGKSRKGPTFREALLMHAVARLALHTQIDNIQSSWVKMGEVGIQACLDAGVNDLGGTLMNETITRSAGANHGQEKGPEVLENIIARAGRHCRQRNTVYGDVRRERFETSFAAAQLMAVENTSIGKKPLAAEQNPVWFAHRWSYLRRVSWEGVSQRA